jgi:hypothetical protein
MEKIRYSDIEGCLRLSNGEIEVIVTTEVGPRIIGYSFVGGENILGLHPQAKVETELGMWKPIGGHRLWIAPETMPDTYAPDDAPVEYSYDAEKNSLRLIQAVEPVSQTQKEITIALDKQGSGVSINHRITNRGTKEIELAAWALTIMRGGGEAFIPNEPFAAYGAKTLLPVRNLTLWSYTDLSDSRWSFDEEFIRLRVDESKPDPQKIGVLNRQGWVKYKVGDLIFTKRFDFVENATYPDMNSNTEIYTAGSFVELETLAPLRRLTAGDSTEHSEYWELVRENKSAPAG